MLQLDPAGVMFIDQRGHAHTKKARSTPLPLHADVHASNVSGMHNSMLLMASTRVCALDALHGVYRRAAHAHARRRGCTPAVDLFASRMAEEET